VNNFRGAVELAHSVGALALVDAVHYAPYFLCDVKEMDCDFLTCSAYKFYGPHVSVFYGKKHLLESIDFPKLQPAPDTAPERAEMGTQSHEGIAGAAAAIDFYSSLVPQAGSLARSSSPRVRGESDRVSTGNGSDRVNNSTRSRREALISSFAGLRAHSAPQVLRLWEALSSMNGVRMYGPPPHVERTPTVSFTVNNVASTEVARRLSECGLFASHGDFYAQTVIERLGLAPEGLVRVGCACYTSDEEIERLIKEVRAIAGGSAT
jgi:selenocysteine lyase/cysteine desulfurase